MIDPEEKKRRKRIAQAKWRASKGQGPSNRDNSAGLFKCPGCNSYKEKWEFYRNPWSKHEISSYCKSCQKDKSLKKYYEGK